MHVYVHYPYMRASVPLQVCPSRVGSKFIMVRRADGTVAWGLCWVCGRPLINHTDVIGRWEPHGRCRSWALTSCALPAVVNPGQGWSEGARDGEWENKGGWKELNERMRGEGRRRGGEWWTDGGKGEKEGGEKGVDLKLIRPRSHKAIRFAHSV